MASAWIKNQVDICCYPKWSCLSGRLFHWTWTCVLHMNSPECRASVIRWAAVVEWAKINVNGFSSANTRITDVCFGEQDQTVPYMYILERIQKGKLASLSYDIIRKVKQCIGWVGQTNLSSLLVFEDYLLWLFCNIFRHRCQYVVTHTAILIHDLPFEWSWRYKPMGYILQTDIERQ